MERAGSQSFFDQLPSDDFTDEEQCVSGKALEQASSQAGLRAKSRFETSLSAGFIKEFLFCLINRELHKMPRSFRIIIKPFKTVLKAFQAQTNK